MTIEQELAFAQLRHAAIEQEVLDGKQAIEDVQEVDVDIDLDDVFGTEDW